MDIEQSSVDNFVIKLQKLLEDHDLKGLQSLIDDEDQALWAQAIWPVFDTVGPFLKGVNESGEDFIVAPKFTSALRSIVRHVSGAAKPKEALLAILEALEKFVNDGIAYAHLLDPLASVVSRLGGENGTRRKKTYILALSTAYRHIQKLPPIQMENMEKMSELNLVDQGTDMTRTVASLSSMIEFLSQLLPEMEEKWNHFLVTYRNYDSSSSLIALSAPPSNPFTCEDLEIQAYFKQVLALFDVPLSRCHLNLPSGPDEDAEPAHNGSSASTEPTPELLRKIGVTATTASTNCPSSSTAPSSLSDLNAIFRRLLRLVTTFCPDVVKLLVHLRVEVARVDKLRKRRQDREEEEEDESGEKMVELTSTVGGCLAHATFHELIASEDGDGGGGEAKESSSFSHHRHLPSVYSRRHLLFLAANFVPSLLLCDEELVILKGVQTLETLVRHIATCELDKNALEDLGLRRVLAAVTERVLVKCPSKLIRRRAVEWIRDLAGKFDVTGRFFYIRGLYYSSGHAGFKGYVLTYLLKPEIEAAFNKKQRGQEQQRKKSRTAESHDDIDDKESESSLFLGSNMKSWFGKIFTMPNGAETDLLQHQDTIMAALNLLRYLLIRDPLVNNWSGIWNLRRMIDEEFLQPYRKALDLSKAHYELELTQIESGARDPSRTEIAVDVANDAASCDRRLPVNQEVDVLRIALRNFDLMESVLCRVVELAQIPNKEKDC